MIYAFASFMANLTFMFATYVVCCSCPSSKSTTDLLRFHSTSCEPFSLLLLSNELIFLRSTKALIVSFTSDKDVYNHTRGSTFHRLNMTH